MLIGGKIMKILKIVVSGFRLLEDGFELNFLNKARVSSTDREDEIIELRDNLYMPTTTVFTGKNGSGKSSVLSLIEFTGKLLNAGRVEYKKLDFRSANIELEIYFLNNEKVYYYTGTISPPEKSFLLDGKYCYFSKEKLFSKKYVASKGRRILEEDFKNEETYYTGVIDTSILYGFSIENKLSMINIVNCSNELMFYKTNTLIKCILEENILVMKILKLFDDGILEFTYDEIKELFILNLKGIGKKEYTEKEINLILSDGTKKGLEILLLVVHILNLGGTLIIDEIENSFHKNFIENLIMIFNDRRINKNKANLMFTTHYVEIVDIFRRNDNIYVMNKNKFITTKNIYVDYKGRVELSKSNQFNNNTFNTLINYDHLIDLKKTLFNEIPNNVRG